MNNVSFKAQFVDKTTVKVQNKNGEFVDKEVSFVKMNPYSEQDNNAVLDINRLWGEETFVESMLNHFNIIVGNNNKNLYFVTEQEGKFRKLIPQKVLGMVEISKFKDYSKINFIQTKPENTFKNKERTYKNIGWAMLTMVEKLYGNNKILLNSVKDAVKFYEKYGFSVTYDKCINPRMMLNRIKTFH